MNPDTVPTVDDFPAREYGSLPGRWPSSDPLGIGAVDPTDPQSWNRYAYVRNSALNAIDPAGTNCVWDDGSYDAGDDPTYGDTPQGQSNCAYAGGTWIDYITGDWNPNENGDLAAEVADIQSTSPSAWVYGGPNAAQNEVLTALNYFGGDGPKPTLVYESNDPFTQGFQQSMAMQGILSRIASSCSKNGADSVGTFEAFVNTVMDGFEGYPGGDGSAAGFLTPEAQLGAFNFTYSRNSATVNITVTNPISLNSASYHITSHLGIKNPTSGHLGTIHQELHMIAANPCGS
jgi:RHS repeat-associated protein